jgi:hypothetical protein
MGTWGNVSQAVTQVPGDGNFGNTRTLVYTPTNA